MTTTALKVKPDSRNPHVARRLSLTVSIVMALGRVFAGTYAGTSFTGDPTLWTGFANDGDWANPNNWSNTVSGVCEVPAAGNTALFYDFSTKTVDTLGTWWRIDSMNSAGPAVDVK